MTSSGPFSRRQLLKGAVASGGALLLGGTTQGRVRGLDPSTTARPYALPSAAGVAIQPILTTGDSADNGYRMAHVYSQDRNTIVVWERTSG